MSQERNSYNDRSHMKKKLILLVLFIFLAVMGCSPFVFGKKLGPVTTISQQLKYKKQTLY